MEFQFGTNWSRFSRFSGEVVGQTLAMEGVFAFFLESTLLGPGPLRRASARAAGRHLAVAIALALGSWLSGYFIIVTNAFMQHPVGYRLSEDGILHLASFSAYLLNPWALWQYAHTMLASVVTASFVVAAVGAYWAVLAWASTPGTPRFNLLAVGSHRRDWCPACWLRPRPGTGAGKNR